MSPTRQKPVGKPFMRSSVLLAPPTGTYEQEEERKEEVLKNIYYMMCL